MANYALIIIGIAVLSIGTYLMRLSGAKLGNKLPLSEHSRTLLTDAATTLLFAVALTATFYESGHFAGMARILGITVAVFLAWRRMPLIIVILVAVSVTALLRYAGIK
ncbi:AzlD domain-containing protein [Xenorhabdus sp. PB62.4]|uniref:AzlD domain-containing protein n=1 Tax=Xenorhabdus sp. PB62.4 TaxID=1851573 RepID=UPI001656EC13|nr:AzlD domain-containing protein [Xenorhabdus sp. PB62.4]MBC8954942.1 branched-chain amino acid transport [Xenorhabdus sp. PB62.4]